MKKIKKKVMCLSLVAILLAMAIPAFAESRDVHNASYSAGKVNHWFNTSGFIAKSSSETWILIADNVSYSRYCDKTTDEVVSASGAHITYLVSGTGDVLSSGRTATGSNTRVSFSASELGSANNAASIKLRIYNPKYNSGENLYLQTAGSFSGTTKSGVEESSVPGDLD